MKVLWFTNTPSLAEDSLYKRSFVGGWIKSLEQQLNLKVELNISFYSKNFKEPFKRGNTSYYPIYKNRKDVLHNIFNPNYISIETQKYLNIIEIIQPDIIHIHGTEKPFGVIANSTNVPLVISLQGIIKIIERKYFSGLKPHVLFLNKLTLKNYLIQFLFLKQNSRLETNILKNCKNIIGRTQWDMFVSSILAPNAHYYHCDEIMRTHFYDSFWTPRNKENECTIFSTIRPDIYKGLETLLEAIYIINLNSTIKFKCVIAGMTKLDYLTKLTKNVLKKKYPDDNILFLGNLDEIDLIKNMKTSDIYVTSSHIENSPNNLCEAMLLGMPIIASNVGGIPTLIENKKTGILFFDSDPYSLAGAIKYLHSNKDISNELANNARQIALFRHNPQKIANEVLKIYSEIINKEINI